MTRIRSPGYPGISLSKAIDIVDKLFSRVRNNTVDREAAVKDIGYSGLTGQSSKILSDLAHFSLIEKSGKGGIRVTELAARILHPHNAKERATALQEAAYSPELFAHFKTNWPDGHVSENALRAWLMRAGFASVALQPVIRSYMETYAFLQQENAIESYDGSNQVVLNPAERADADAGVQLPALRQESYAVAEAHLGSGVRIVSGEQVVFVEAAGPDQYLKLVVAGQMDETLLEALEDYVRRQKKRLGVSRHEPLSAQISHKYGDTLISTLRGIYGQGFAAGYPDTTKLSEVLLHLNETSLSQLRRDYDAGELDEKIIQFVPRQVAN